MRNYFGKNLKKHNKKDRPSKRGGCYGGRPSPYRKTLSVFIDLLALRLKPVFEEKAKEKQREAGGTVPQKSAKPPIETRNEIAKLAGVSDVISLYISYQAKKA